MREVPGAEVVDACVAAAAGALEVEGEAAQGVLDGVLVVGADISGGGWGEGGAVGVGEECGEVVVEGCWVGRERRSGVGYIGAFDIIVVVVA